METSSDSTGGTGSSITVTTKIVRSESPLLQIPGDSNHGLSFPEGRSQTQPHSAAASTAKVGRRSPLAPMRQTEDDHEPCPSPAVHDRRMKNILPLVRPQSGFEESPEWRQHYDRSSKTYTGEGPYLREQSDRLRSDQSSMNSMNFSTETFITAQALPERRSVDTIELSSRTLLCLRRPASRANLLKAGNARLKQLISLKSKTYPRTKAVAEENPATVGPLPQLDLAASSQDRVRRRQKGKRAKPMSPAIPGSQRALRSKESCTSIVDLDQVEARHGLEKYHRNALSQSWDEIVKSMGGFSAGTAHNRDGTQHGSHPAVTALNAIESDLPPFPTSLSAYGLRESPPPPPQESTKSPPSPGPRTSSVTANVNAGPIRRNVQIMAAELPAQSPPHYRSKSKPTNQADSYTEGDMQSMPVEESVQPRLQDVRSLGGLSSSVPGPDASQSTIALEAIEAELYHGQPLSPSMSAQSMQPFSINCTPPQPVTAPTDPPIGPLPELPEELERPNAGSRASSHNSSSKQMSRPPVPPRAPHRRSPSSNSGSSRLIVRATSPHKGHHRRHTCVSTRSSKKAVSVKSSQSQEAVGVSSRLSPQPKSVVPMSNNAHVTGFNAFNLGNSHDLRSPAASEIGQENEVIDARLDMRSTPSTMSHDALVSRTEHIKGLKLRDLAKEKATRTRNRHPQSHLDDGIVMEDSTLSRTAETTVQTSHLSRDFAAPSKPLGPFEAAKTGDPRPASRQESVKRRPSYQSPRSPSGQVNQRTLLPILGQSQIMVLAETDPETQTFRAATPTGSVRRSESKKAESLDLTKELKLRKRRSKSSLRSQVYGKTASGGMSGIKPSGEHTPPHSDPSPHSSDDDDMAGLGGTKRQRSVKHIAALVREDSDVESAPSKRAFVALACNEEKKYLAEQLHLKRLKRESSELKLAMRLLSRGLEKLTTFVEADEEDGNAGAGGLIEAEMDPVRGVAERFERALSSDDWRMGSDAASVTGKRGSWHGGPQGLLRVRSAKVNDSRPTSLLSRYTSVRNSVGESVIGGGPAIREEVIWGQVDGLNRAAGVGSRGFVSYDY